MAEATNGATGGETKKRFRSPPYPSIHLKRAIERSKQLHTKALHHAVGAKVLGESWDLKESSGGIWSIAAALLHFGLLKDEGTGDKRKFQLTEGALRIIRDADPDSSKRREAIQRSALAPVIHRELWDKYGDASGISDVVLKNHLTLDRSDDGKAPFSDDAADDLIKEYKETISFADLAKGAIVPPVEEAKGAMPNDGTPSKGELVATVGDLVQVEIGGTYQLEQPKRIRAVQDYEGAKWAFIEGSETGIPVDQIRIIEAGGVGPTKTPPILPLEPGDDVPSKGARKEVASLDEGAATLIWPDDLSKESVADFEHWLSGILRKAQRRAGVTDVRYVPGTLRRQSLVGGAGVRDDEPPNSDEHLLPKRD